MEGVVPQRWALPSQVCTAVHWSIWVARSLGFGRSFSQPTVAGPVLLHEVQGPLCKATLFFLPLNLLYSGLGHLPHSQVTTFSDFWSYFFFFTWKSHPCPRKGSLPRLPSSSFPQIPFIPLILSCLFLRHWLERLSFIEGPPCARHCAVVYINYQSQTSQCHREVGTVTTLILPLWKLRLSTLYKGAYAFGSISKILRFKWVLLRMNNNDNGNENRLLAFEATWYKSCLHDIRLSQTFD